jgi:hypothetical protein
MYCPICKKEVEAVKWTSQPLSVCPDCGNVPDCACLDSDARRCFELRYPNRTIGDEYESEEVCGCTCHEEENWGEND